ncbi:hypothetical protein [Nocardia sp. NPDC047654]|uniref:hypothetical protein n=1 Tax=Nocardia sp. NPDC047654 TaxID=3364314 RepID=UPI003719A8ED
MANRISVVTYHAETGNLSAAFGWDLFQRAIDRNHGVYLVGHMVAAPGMRGEISINSALRAADAATASLKAHTRVNTAVR